MLSRVFDWVMSLARHRHARWALAGVAFAESSFLPVPPDALLIPMALADRAGAYWFAAICTAGSVVGGLFGYAIGAVAFHTIGRPLFGPAPEFAEFQRWYSTWGFLIVFIAGLAPLPYKVFTITSGVAALNPAVFISAALASRGLRFFGEAALLRRFGAPVAAFLDNHRWVFAAALVALIVVGMIVGALA